MRGKPRTAGKGTGPLMQLRSGLTWLRVLLGAVGLLAVVWGAAWAYGLGQALKPDFNPKSAPSNDELRPLMILGCLGVLASLLTGGSALAFVKTANRRWAVGLAVAVACGVLLFVVFVDVWELAGGCS